MLTDPIFYIAAVPAVILLGLSKGGFAGVSAMALPVLALVISPVQAAAILLPVLIVQDVVSVWVFRKEWDAATLILMIPSATVGIVLGYLLAAKVSPTVVLGVLGGISPRRHSCRSRSPRRWPAYGWFAESIPSGSTRSSTCS